MGGNRFGQQAYYLEGVLLGSEPAADVGTDEREFGSTPPNSGEGACGGGVLVGLGEDDDDEEEDPVGGL